MALPVAALPFLAIGGTAALSPLYDNYRARMHGRYARRATEGVDMSDPRAAALGLFNAGLLGPEDYQADLRAGFEGEADRAAAMARQQVASGPGYMNAQLARDKFNLAVRQDQVMHEGVARIAEATGMPEVYRGVPSLERSWVETHAGATFSELNRSTRQVLEDEAAIATAENVIADQQTGQNYRVATRDMLEGMGDDQVMNLAEQATGYRMADPGTARAMLEGNPATWLGPVDRGPSLDLSAEQIERSYDSLGMLGGAADAVRDAVIFAQETTRGGRAFNDVDQAALQSRVDNVVIPAIARAREMGAIDQEEAKRLEQQLGVGGAYERGEVMAARLQEVLEYLEASIEGEQRFFEAGTTPRQREALGYTPRSAGQAPAPPPGTVSGAAQ